MSSVGDADGDADGHSIDDVVANGDGVAIGAVDDVVGDGDDDGHSDDDNDENTGPDDDDGWFVCWLSLPLPLVVGDSVSCLFVMTVARKNFCVEMGISRYRIQEVDIFAFHLLSPAPSPILRY